MANINSILDQRMKKNSNTSKMTEMAKQSAAGQLTSFSGVFNMVELNEKEKQTLATILKNYANELSSLDEDLHSLISLTAEVKAINNQAALLHGERIKKVQLILTKYRDGAFTAWLMMTYGNRQTPYNLLQYYEFCETMPKQLRQQIEIMPRQAIYVLASRAGEIEQKQRIVENYQGETKAEMLSLIRQVFPLSKTDKRKQKTAKHMIENLQKICKQFKNASFNLTTHQKNQVSSFLKQIQQLVGI